MTVAVLSLPSTRFTMPMDDTASSHLPPGRSPVNDLHFASPDLGALFLQTRGHRCSSLPLRAVRERRALEIRIATAPHAVAIASKCTLSFARARDSLSLAREHHSVHLDALARTPVTNFVYFYPLRDT